MSTTPLPLQGHPVIRAILSMVGDDLVDLETEDGDLLLTHKNLPGAYKVIITSRFLRSVPADAPVSTVREILLRLLVDPKGSGQPFTTLPPTPNLN